METDFDLDLGDDVDYRVRVARRGDNWLLCSWPDPEIEPPVWRARSAPVVMAGDDGWSSELPHPLMEMSYVAGDLARDADGDRRESPFPSTPTSAAAGPRHHGAGRW